jgi:hypothetical protein
VRQKVAAFKICTIVKCINMTFFVEVLHQADENKAQSLQGLSINENSKAFEDSRSRQQVLSQLCLLCKVR